MPFEFKPITRKIDLADYDPAYTGAIFDVWVNLPRVKFAEFYAIRQETIKQINTAQANPTEDEATLDERGEILIELNKRLCGWFADVWSKGAEAWDAEKVQALMEHLLDTDPQAWTWLIRTTEQTIVDYRQGNRKN